MMTTQQGQPAGPVSGQVEHPENLERDHQQQREQHDVAAERFGPPLAGRGQCNDFVVCHLCLHKYDIIII